jgi:signal peptidase I
MYPLTESTSEKQFGLRKKHYFEQANENQEGDVNTMCQQEQTQSTRKQKETVWKFVVKLVLIILAVWAIFTFVFGIRQVSGETMYPRLRDGDLILYYRLEQDYQIGDVVTFNLNGTTFWCRIVAQGGDVVELDTQGQLLVNGNVQQEEIFYPTEAQKGNFTYPYTVEEGSYFVLCDFRTEGYDSRSFGAVSKNTIDGKVITLLRRRGI